MPPPGITPPPPRRLSMLRSQLLTSDLITKYTPAAPHNTKNYFKILSDARTYLRPLLKLELTLAKRNLKKNYAMKFRCKMVEKMGDKIRYIQLMKTAIGTYRLTRSCEIVSTLIEARKLQWIRKEYNPLDKAHQDTINRVSTFYGLLTEQQDIPLPIATAPIFAKVFVDTGQIQKAIAILCNTTPTTSPALYKEICRIQIQGIPLICQRIYKTHTKIVTKLICDAPHVQPFIRPHIYHEILLNLYHATGGSRQYDIIRTIIIRNLNQPPRTNMKHQNPALSSRKNCRATRALVRLMGSQLTSNIDPAMFAAKLIPQPYIPYFIMGLPIHSRLGVIDNLAQIHGIRLRGVEIARTCLYGADVLLRSQLTCRLLHYFARCGESCSFLRDDLEVGDSKLRPHFLAIIEEIEAESQNKTIELLCRS